MRQLIAFILCIFISTLFPQITLAQEAGFSDFAGIVQLMTPEQRASLSNNNAQQMTPAEEKEFNKLINTNDSSGNTTTQSTPVFHQSKPAPQQTDDSVILYPHQDN